MKWKLVSYVHDYDPRSGIVVAGRLYDASQLLQVPRFKDVSTILDEWDAATQLLAGVSLASASDVFELTKMELLSPLLRPGAIYCAGANYRDHVANMARRLGIAPEPDPHEVGLPPWHFIKSSRCVVGDKAKVELDSSFLDWEAELAVVIGRRARHVSIESALRYVAGYTIANDLSARDRTIREPTDISSPFRYDWIGQKNFDGACPIGPWIIPAQDIPDPQNLGIRTFVNDKIRQDSNTGLMMFSIAEQISYLSSRITLHPGDVILTGTPAGVGAETGDHLDKGDIIRIEIAQIGHLTTEIV